MNRVLAIAVFLGRWVCRSANATDQSEPEPERGDVVSLPVSRDALPRSLVIAARFPRRAAVRRGELFRPQLPDSMTESEQVLMNCRTEFDAWPFRGWFADHPTAGCRKDDLAIPKDAV